MATKTPANVLKMATTRATHGLSPFQLEVRKTYSRSNCKELWVAPLEHAYKTNENTRDWAIITDEVKSIKGCKFRASNSFLGDELYYEARVNNMLVMEVYPQYKVLSETIMKAIGMAVPIASTPKKRKRKEKSKFTPSNSNDSNSNSKNKKKKNGNGNGKSNINNPPTTTT